MRITLVLASLWLAMNAGTSLAQQQVAGNPEPPSGAAGPAEGRHHQPSAAEIDRRERATGESDQAIREHARRQDKVIDDLYKELMTPVPSGGRSSSAGEKTR